MKTYRKSEASWSHNRNQKMTTILYSNQVILPPFPPLGEGGEGGRGGPNFVVTLASKHFTKCTRLYLSDFLPTCGYEQAVHPPYQLGRKSGRFTNPFVLTGPVRTFWKKERPLPLLRVTYVDVDTVTGRLNENLPKVISKLVPQSKPKNDNNIIQQ